MTAGDTKQRMPAEFATANGPMSPLAIMHWMSRRHPVFHLLQMEILQVGENASRLVMPVTPAISNTYGVAQGGIIFTFADICFGFTANATTNLKGLTTQAEIHWTASGLVGDRLIGETTEVWQKGRNGLYDVRVISEKSQELVAIVHGRVRFIGGAVVDADLPE